MRTLSDISSVYRAALVQRQRPQLHEYLLKNEGYYSLQEILEAVWAEINKSAVNHDLSSIVITFSEFLQNTYSASLNDIPRQQRN